MRAPRVTDRTCGRRKYGAFPAPDSTLRNALAPLEEVICRGTATRRGEPQRGTVKINYVTNEIRKGKGYDTELPHFYAVEMF